MQHISDSWHWLEAGLAIAEVSLQTNDLVEFKKYIREAEQVAREIQSLTPGQGARALARLLLLQGDHANAMLHYKRGVAMRDSIQGVQRSNVYLDMRVNYERDRNERLVANRGRGRRQGESPDVHLVHSHCHHTDRWQCHGGTLHAYKERNRSNKLLKEMERTRSDFHQHHPRDTYAPHRYPGLNKRLQEHDSITEKERVAYRKAIDRQSNNMLSMVNQLLSVAKVGR